MAFPEELGLDRPDQLVGFSYFFEHADTLARPLGGLFELLEQGVHALDQREVRLVDGGSREAQEAELE